MSLGEISVETMLGDPQENDIAQLHHVIINENMFGICKGDIQLTHKKKKTLVKTMLSSCPSNNTQ